MTPVGVEVQFTDGRRLRLTPTREGDWLDVVPEPGWWTVKLITGIGNGGLHRALPFISYPAETVRWARQDRQADGSMIGDLVKIEEDGRAD